MTPTYHIRSPTGDKPWYPHRGKLTAKLHHAFHLGLTNEGREAAKQSFAAPSTTITQILLLRAPLYGFPRTELHRAGTVTSSPFGSSSCTFITPRDPTAFNNQGLTLQRQKIFK